MLSSFFNTPENRLIGILRKVHHTKYGKDLQYWCAATEREVVESRPNWGRQWPFDSPFLSEREAGYRLYEVYWKYYFVGQIAPVSVLIDLARKPLHDIDAKSVDIQFAVDWYPPDNPEFRDNYIEKVRAMAMGKTLEICKIYKPYYAGKYDIFDVTESTVEEEWVDFPLRLAYQKWKHLLEQYR